MRAWIKNKLARAFESKGIQGPEYLLDQPKDYSLFLRNLHSYFPSGSFLYLEDPSTSGKMAAVLQKYKEAHPLKIAPDTLWPKSQGYHLPLSDSLYCDLAEAEKNLAAPEICIHLKVHDGKALLLHWHDFPDNILFVTATIGEEAVSRMAKDLQTSYEAAPEGV